MPKMPIPFMHWPRTVADLETLDARLGGRTSILVRPQPVDAVSGRRKRAQVEYWLEFDEAQPSMPPAARELTDSVVREFLRQLARRAASAWAREAARAKGR